MTKKNITTAMASAILLTMILASPVSAKTVKCLVTGTPSFEGHCGFGFYEEVTGKEKSDSYWQPMKQAKGSFWLTAKKGTNNFLEGTLRLRVIISSPGKGDISVMTDKGVNTKWGPVTRSKQDRACWLFENGDKICAW